MRMTREQAINTVVMRADHVRATVNDGCGSHQRNMNFCDLVTALEALGLLKLDEPVQIVPKTYLIPVTTTYDGRTAVVLEDTLIKTLRGAGYEVTKR